MDVDSLWQDYKTALTQLSSRQLCRRYPTAASWRRRVEELAEVQQRVCELRDFARFAGSNGSEWCETGCYKTPCFCSGDTAVHMPNLHIYHPDPPLLGRCLRVMWEAASAASAGAEQGEAPPEEPDVKSMIAFFKRQGDPYTASLLEELPEGEGGDFDQIMCSQAVQRLAQRVVCDISTGAVDPATLAGSVLAMVEPYRSRLPLQEPMAEAIFGMLTAMKQGQPPDMTLATPLLQIWRGGR